MAAAGVAFLLAGVALFINGIDTRYRTALLRINAALLLTAFGTVPIAIAWSSGPKWLLVGGIVCLVLAASAVRAAVQEVGRVARERRGVPSPILPASELQQQYGLYAENRPAIRLDPRKVPAELRDLVPLAETWGIGDDIIRFDLVQKAPESAQRELMDGLDGRTDAVQAWLRSQPEGTALSDEAAAFMSMLSALDEMQPPPAPSEVLR
ncbi:MAG: hypothetical protein AB7O37_19015 [Vicinamibacteria bacterium]